MTATDILDRLSNIKSHGDYYTARCPAHDDNKNSLQVKTMPTGKVSIQCFAGCTIDRICDEIDIKKSDLYPDKPTGRTISDVYPYTDADGNLLYEVVRYVPKDFRPRVPDPSSRDGYRYSMKNTPRVLFNLPAVLYAIAHNKIVLFVEGEKDALTARAHGITATCIAGGASAPWTDDYTSVLSQANKLVIVPDNDEPGRNFAHRIQKQLPHAVIVNLPGLSDKQDLTDWLQKSTPQDLIALIRNAYIEKTAPLPPARDNEPFRALGFNAGRYHFFSHRTGQILDFSAAAFGQRTTFLQLADLNYWYSTPYADDSGKIDYTALADYLMNTLCLPAGLFDENRIRGRGAWLDDGKTILHMGDRLIIDGKPVAIEAHVSDYIYPRSAALKLQPSEPLSDDQAKRLFELSRALRWNEAASAYFLAGWIALAPICGVLPWRPHIWVSGPAGSGKTTVVNEVIGAILQDLAIKVQSASTEAGIRQLIGQDALPVTFDECELDDKQGQETIKKVLALARQASSLDAAKIVKGAPLGKPQEYQTRSMFCFSSISVGVTRSADETRVVHLELAPPVRSADHWKALQATIRDICTPAYGAALAARSCALAPIIRANSETFAVALTSRKDRRFGDQYGALLAGWYSLMSDAVLTIEEATDIVYEIPMEFDAEAAKQETDEAKCLQYILDYRLRFESGELTVAELIETSQGETDSKQTQEADKLLRRHGLAFRSGMLLVAWSHSAVASMLQDTPWSNKWGIFLARIPGAKTGRDVPMVKMGGTPRRCVAVPVTNGDTPMVTDFDVLSLYN